MQHRHSDIGIISNRTHRSCAKFFFSTKQRLQHHGWAIHSWHFHVATRQLSQYNKTTITSLSKYHLHYNAIRAAKFVKSKLNTKSICFNLDFIAVIARYSYLYIYICPHCVMFISSGSPSPTLQICWPKKTTGIPCTRNISVIFL